jgi:hypothetical protein
MTFEDLPESERNVRLLAARHLARVAGDNSQDGGSAFRSAFEMSLERAHEIAELRELSPVDELPQPLTDVERAYLAAS